MGPTGLACRAASAQRVCTNWVLWVEQMKWMGLSSLGRTKAPLCQRRGAGFYTGLGLAATAHLLPPWPMKLAEHLRRLLPWGLHKDRG